MSNRFLVLAMLGAQALAQEAAQSEAAQTAMKSTVEGVVLNELSKEPLKDVRVRLFRVDKASGYADRDNAAYSAQTDALGRFRVEEAEPGLYEVSRDKTGFVEGRAIPGAVSGPENVTLVPGETQGELRYTLAPEAIVTGRVFDEDGKPVRGANVMLTLSLGRIKRLRSGSVRTTTTNDKGEYRLSEVWPGRYYLHGAPPEAAALAAPIATSQAGGSHLAYVTTYYPDTPNLAQATSIELAAGQEVSGQDIILRKEKVVNVSGTVLGSNGAPSKNVALRLAPSDVSDFPDQLRSTTDNQGGFTIKDLPPGDYLVVAINQSGGGDERLAFLQLQVGDTDMEGVTLQMQTLQAAGAFTLQGQEKKNVDFGGCYISVRPVASDFAGGSRAQARRDGTFKLERLTAGKIVLNAFCRAGGDSYIESILVGGQDVLGREVDSAALVASGVQVNLRQGVASFDGILDIPDGKRAALKGAGIVLLPTEARLRRAGLVARSGIDPTNHFQNKDVRPGEYLAFAFEETNAQAFEDPDFYTLVQSMGQHVTLAPLESKTLYLKLVPWPMQFANRIHP